MTRATLLSLVLSMSLLVGCTLQRTSAPTASVDELARNHQYNSALALLKQTARGQPDYRERRRELLDAAHAWEAQLIEALDQLIAREQFAAAQLQLENAAKELPETPALRHYMANFYAQRDAFITQQTEALARLRGEDLLREQANYEKLRGVEGDYQIRDAVERYQEDAEFFAGKLREGGLRAVDAGNWADAVTLLSIANQLHPDAFTASELATAQAQMRALHTEEQIALRERQHTLRSTLQKRFDSAMAAADLQRAAAVVSESTKLADNSFTRHLQQQLTSAQQTAALADIAAGDRLYGDGKVEKALRHWQSAQRYDKSAELQMKIDRAQRMLEHYHQLSEQNR